MENTNIKNKIYLLLAILWMGTIFYLSNQPAEISTAQSGGVIELLSNIPIIGSLVSAMMEVDIAQFIIRKAAHMSAFCILAILWFLAIYKPNNNIKSTSMKAFTFTVIYACTDEIHQLFVQGRSGEIRDVMIDSTGALIGTIIIYFTVKTINKRKNKLN